jgi:hypothetical protein
MVNLFAAWESFYVIIGSSAAALTGLQFVIMTLIADSGRPGGRKEVAAFGSPTVVHFCSALVISGVFTAPWPAPASAGRAASLIGLGGLVYTAIVLRRARSQGGYKPVLEDWVWHTVLPAVAYLVLLVSGLMLADEAGIPPFFVGGAALLLVLIGIHNAWDTVTYITLEQRTAGPGSTGEPGGAAVPDPRPAADAGTQLDPSKGAIEQSERQESPRATGRAGSAHHSLHEPG